MITIPIGVSIMEEMRIQGELVRCEVIGGKGGQVEGSKSRGIWFAVAEVVVAAVIAFVVVALINGRGVPATGSGEKGA